jgi:hypothetical protein
VREHTVPLGVEDHRSIREGGRCLFREAVARPRDMEQVIRYIAQQADLFMKEPEVRSAWLVRREIIMSSIFLWCERCSGCNR